MVRTVNGMLHSSLFSRKLLEFPDILLVGLLFQLKSLSLKHIFVQEPELMRFDQEILVDPIHSVSNQDNGMGIVVFLVV